MRPSALEIWQARVGNFWEEWLERTDGAVVDWGYAAITFGLPLLLLLSPLVFRKPDGSPGRSKRGSIVYSMLVGWVLLVIWGVSVDSLWHRMNMIRPEDVLNDGVGANVARIMTGWFMMLPGIVPAVIVRLCLEALIGRRPPSKPPPPHPLAAADPSSSHSPPSTPQD